MFPNLTDASLISLDYECKDPGLTEVGTDAIRRRHPESRILGVSVAVEPPYDWYFHWDTPGVEDFVRDIWRGQGKVIGANLKYDILWSFSYGLWTAEQATKRYGDVIVNGALIDSEADYDALSLDGQGTKYGYPPKLLDKLMEAGAAVGLKTKKQIMGNLDKLPPHVVAEYGQYDARLAYDVYVRQMDDIKAWKLDRVLDLEERLLPIVALMETRGVPVDEEAVEQIRKDIKDRMFALQHDLNQEAGFIVTTGATNQMREFLANRLGISGKSIAKPVLEPFALNDPFMQNYLELKSLDKFMGTYIDGTFTKHTHQGMIYPSWRQTSGAKGEDKGGARTGRMTCTNPSLVNIPIRNKTWGKKIRALIKKHDAAQACLAADFSQAEPRWIVHLSAELNIPGATEACLKFQNPDEDWHQQVADMSEVDRGNGKTLFLGRAYMGGVDTLHAQSHGATIEQIRNGIMLMDEAFPWLRMSGEAHMRTAEQQGFIRTILGRIRRFPLWAPARYSKYKETPLPYEIAKAKWFDKGVPIKRANCYMAMNSRVQGSSADEAKQSIVNLFYNYKLYPSILVYDELVDCYVEDQEAWRVAYKDAMETAMPKRVPTRVDIELAERWQKP